MEHRSCGTTPHWRGLCSWHHPPQQCSTSRCAICACVRRTPPPEARASRPATSSSRAASGWSAAGSGISLGPDATSNRPTQIIAPYLEANGTNIALSSASAPAAFASRWTVVKQAPTARHSTTTVSQDPDLGLTMVAGHKYMFEMALIYDGPASATADLKVSLIAQGVPPVIWAVDGLDTTTGITAPHGPANRSVWQTSGALQSFATAGVGTPAAASIKGTVGPGAGGTFALRWAQRVSNATSVTLYAGSSLTMELIG
jgi:hypothetical protein